MTDPERKLRTQELYGIIQGAEAELILLRATCRHPEWKVGMYSWRVGSYNPSRICEVCGSPIEGITPEESKACFDDWNKSTIATTSGWTFHATVQK